MENKVDAMTLGEENPYFRLFLKNREKILNRVAKSRFKMRRQIEARAKRKNQTLPASFYENNASDIDNEYLFLCFMTRKYFKDNFLISLAKFLIGVAAIVLAVLMEDIIPVPHKIKGAAMVFAFTYGLVMSELSILYMIANLVCLKSYINCVTTRNSYMAKKIIYFYDEDTDKFQTVNWKQVFDRDRSEAAERKRMRGW